RTGDHRRHGRRRGDDRAVDPSSHSADQHPGDGVRSVAMTTEIERRAEQRRRRQGFTLVELMVVIVIIGLLATVVAINVLPSQDRAMVGKAKADISVLEQAIETYRLDNLTFPDDLQALVAPPAGLAQRERYRQGGYIRRLPEDPWGNAYQYRRQSAHGGQFDVFSLGADGKEGGEGNDADL